jgi:thioredoxin-related protein
MKTLALTLLTVLAFGSAARAAEAKWNTDLPAAIAKAKAENKTVLVNFTGSDWCGWCIKLKNETFTKQEFNDYAAKNLVLVELDFPRSKPQPDALKQANRKLQSQYQVRGFPTLVALDGNGKELWKNPGYVPGGPAGLIAKLDAAKKK